MSDELDRSDVAILHALQDDARNATTESIGDDVGLAASTVASRIKDLEERGVVTGYAPEVDYDVAGFGYHGLVVGTIVGEDEDEVVDRTTDVDGVVGVTELVTDEENLIVEVVCPDQERAEDVTDELGEIGVEILRTEMVRRTTSQTFNHSGTVLSLEE